MNALIYMELDPKVQDLRIAFEKAVTARKKTLFLDAYLRFFEKLEEFKRLAKKLGLSEEDIYRYFPDVGYMEKSVKERYEEWMSSKFSQN